MDKIIYVHGANSTGNSFNYIAHQLPSHSPIYFGYETNTDLKPAIETLTEILMRLGPGVKVVGHSLGGIISLLAADYQPGTKIVTIASPFGGSQVAGALRWISKNPLFHQIYPHSELISSLHAKEHQPEAVLPITACSGRYFGKRGDTIVSLSSQQALSSLRDRYVTLPYNHFEILQSKEVVQHIKEFLWK